MSLSTEDEFRLQVMCASGPKVIRIDDYQMAVYALDKAETEHSFTLTPNCRDEIYVRKIRGVLADKFGFPGGYPAQINRWTEMGQIRSANYRSLLLLGDPEAVIAVSTSPDITAELARCAWWALPSTDNARYLLQHAHLLDQACGTAVVAHLLEHLPFEQNPRDISNIVSRLLKSGWINQKQCEELWSKTQRKCCYMLGFLQAPEHIPDIAEDNPALKQNQISLDSLSDSGNTYARTLTELLSDRGQSRLTCFRQALKRPEDQDIMVALINALAATFSRVWPDQCIRKRFDGTVSNTEQLISTWVKKDPQIQQFVSQAPALSTKLQSVLALALVNEQIVSPILSRSTATGGLMRRKLMPVLHQLDDRLGELLSSDGVFRVGRQ